MSTLFFRHRRLLALTIALIVVAGLSSYAVLPRAEDPALTKRAARVITPLPGAGAERVEALVTEPLEDKLREIEEIREIISSSRAGVSVVNVELHDDVPAGEISAVWSRVRDKVSDAAALLPAGAGESEFDELEIAAFTLIAAVTWERDDAPAYGILSRVAEELQDALQAVPGTAEVERFGEPAEEVRVEVDAARLAALDLTVADVARALQRADAKVPAGEVHLPGSDLLVEVAGEVDSLTRVERIPVRIGADGAAIYIGDIATVRKTVADPPSELAWASGQLAVAVAARMEEAQRIDDWAERAHAAIASFRANLPKGLGLNLMFDQSQYVAQRLWTLEQNLLLGVLFVSAVVFVLMGWRAALLVGTALPLASLMVLSGMRILHIPIEQMSVTGLIIALGLLIDNAIVIVDEVRQRLGAGVAPASAVGSAVRHLAIPLAASTFTTVLSFLPLVLMPGGAGEFVGSIGISVTLAVGSSFLLAMTVVPALTGLLSGRVDATHRSFLNDGLTVPRLTAWYRRTLDVGLRHPVLSILFAAALPAVGFWEFSRLDDQFFPPTDRDQLQLELRLPAQTSLAETTRIVHDVRSRLLADPRIRDVHWLAGGSMPKFYYNMFGGEVGSAYYAQALVQLNSERGGAALVRDIQEMLDAAYPAALAVARQLEQGPPYEAPIEIRIFGSDLDTLRTLGEELRRRLAALPNVTHTRATLDDGVPKLLAQVDEEEARMAALDNLAIAEQLRAHLDGAVGGSLLEDTEELPLRVRLAPQERENLAQVATLDLRAGAASRDDLRHVPLAALGELQLTPELTSIPRRDQSRVNAVQAQVRAGVLPATVVAALRSELARDPLALPAGYRMEFGGETAERARAVGNLFASVSVIAVAMVATLVLSFNSFRMAGILGLVALQAGGLAFAALGIFNYPFGFMAIIGTMGLVGVAFNDSIVVLAAIREDSAARAGDPSAIREVVVRATRHILSTTLTTVAGFVPLLIGGGQFWPPLAIAIAAGVVGATPLALYFAPSAYVLLMRPRACVRRVTAAEADDAEDFAPVPA